jgi:hypothetical protein
LRGAKFRQRRKDPGRFVISVGSGALVDSPRQLGLGLVEGRRDQATPARGHENRNAERDETNRQAYLDQQAQQLQDKGGQ